MFEKVGPTGPKVRSFLLVFLGAVVASHAAAQALPAAPAKGHVTPPKDDDALDALVLSKGCPWASADGHAVACWDNGCDMGERTVVMVIFTIPNNTVERFTLYGDPPRESDTGFHAKSVNADQFERLNGLLAMNDFGNGIIELDANKVAHFQGTLATIAVETTRGNVNLPPLSTTLAPAARLRKAVRQCCRWVPAQAFKLLGSGAVVVRFETACRWSDSRKAKPCYDPNWNEENSSAMTPEFRAVQVPSKRVQ